MAKQIIYADEARRAVLKGVEQLARAVKVTLGPKGRSVGLEKKFGPPMIINSGVIVAKDITLKDPFENMGAQMIREVAEKTSESAGDGTTTATILTEAIYREGLRNLMAGANPMALKRGIEAGAGAVISELKNLAKKIETANTKEVEQVATISANSESAIGKIIAEAINKVGKDGVITVEEGKSLTMELKLVEGMQFDQGYLSPYFATDLQKMECELDEPYLLICEKKISVLKEILPLLEKIAQAGKPLVIIAEDVDGDALATLVVNKLRGTFSCAAVKSPGYGDRRKAMLEDIAVLTAGKAITEDLGLKLENLTLAELGRAKKIKIDKEQTTIVEGEGKKKDIEARISQIKGQLKSADSSYDKEKLQERLAKLTGGVAIINVGAATETEMKERKSRVEDALHATRAAIEEGIVPGGGVALLRTLPALGKLKLTGDEQTGVNIIKRALEEPVRQLASNAGLEGSVIVERLLKESTNIGYDINKDAYVDMLESGVVDPAKVTRLALQNASSIASLLLTTEALVAEIPEDDEKEKVPPMPPY